MVSPLDIGLLQTFQVIFPFLFVLTLVFAFLTQIKPFKENYVYAAIIAVSLAVLTMFFPIAIKTINLMAPWFVVLFVAIIFAVIAMYTLGLKEEDLYTAVTEGEYSNVLKWFVFAVSLIIILGSLTQVISEEMGFGPLTAENATATVTQSPGEFGSFFQVLLHPKLLGMAVLLLVAFFAINGLSKPSER